MKLIKEHISDDNFYIELLNESLINEEFNLEKIKEIASNITDKPAAVMRFIKKFNESHNMNVRKYIALILVTLFLSNFMLKNNRWGIGAEVHAESVVSNTEQIALRLAKQRNLSIQKIKNEIKMPSVANDVKKDLIKPKYVNISFAHASDSAKNFIKHHEQLRLQGYSIGDGMITIGYGHASPEKKSKYKVGQKITLEKAEQLFLEDIKEAEDGVKSIIKGWKNPKIETKITQGMFDAMVSMAYNMGNYGLKTTEFMNFVEQGKFKSAAQRLKTTKIKAVTVKDGKKVYEEMPGLINRRNEEYKLFASK